MTEQPQPPKEAAFFTTIRQWGLPRGDHGVVGGVIEGLGARVGLAAVPARLITVFVWLLLPGLVMLGYAAAWGLLPDRRGNIIIQNFGRGVTNVGALLGIGILTLFGFGGLDNGALFNVLNVGNSSWLWDNSFVGGGLSGGGMRGLVVLLFMVFLLMSVVAGVAVLIVWLVRRSNKTQSPPPTATWAAAPHAAPGTGPTSTPGENVPDGEAQEPNAQATDVPTPDAPTPTAQAGGTPPGPVPPAPRAGDSAPASATAPTAVYRPQPWEPALVPGDPRVAAVSGAVPPRPTGPVPGAPGAPSAPGASAAGAQAVPPPPYAQYTPPRPHVPGPGKGGYLSFLAVLLIGAAVVIGIDRMDRLAVNPVLAWGAVVTVGLGVVLIAVALAGRKLGFLGFLSVLAVLAGIPLAANAEDIRADYEAGAGGWDVDVWIGDEPVLIEETATPSDYSEDPQDLTAPFVQDYAEVFIFGQCWTLSESGDADYATDPHSWNAAGQGSIRLDEVTEDTSIDVGDGATTVTVPAGTSIAITHGQNAHVVWEERDLVCDFYDDGTYGDANWLAATNPGDPVLEIVPTGTEVAIFIKEDQS